MHSVGQLAVRPKVLEPQDSLGKAAEAVRASTVGAAPVVQYGVLLGLVTAPMLVGFLAEGSPARFGAMVVADLPLERAVALPEGLSPADALKFFRANYLERASVVDSAGRFVGLITSAELASAVCGRIRPPVIGGMATPFGVYLTGGGVRGGVGDLALMTTGVYMALVNFAAFLLANLLLTHLRWPAHLPALSRFLAPADGFTFGLTYALLFALFFRLSWITGYHAAEHQVVHTIEAGDDLMPDVVREKPRVHPRCGTNIVAAVLIMQGFWWLGTLQSSKDPSPVERIFRDLGASLGDAIPLLALGVVFFYWRRIGGWLQQHITTRPATLQQLESGILAGKQVIERYQQRPMIRLPVWQRIWHMGLLQVMSGWLLVFGLIFVLQWLHVPLPEALKSAF